MPTHHGPATARSAQQVALDKRNMKQSAALKRSQMTSRCKATTRSWGGRWFSTSIRFVKLAARIDDGRSNAVRIATGV